MVKFLLFATFALGNAWGLPLPTALEVAADAQRADHERVAAFDALLHVPNIDALAAVAADPQTHMRQRWIAVRALGKIGGAPVRDTLTPLLRAPEAALRAATVSALADADIRGMAVLVSELLRDPAIIVRSAAADSLARMGEEIAVPALVDALEDPSNVYRGQSLWVRRHFVQALEAIGGHNAVGGLIGALEDSDPTVSAAALAGVDRLVAHSYAAGRSHVDEVQAWKRWWANQQSQR